MFVCLCRKAAATHDREKTESPSGARTKREADNDGADEVSFGKKARLETVLSEEIKYACDASCITVKVSELSCVFASAHSVAFCVCVSSPASQT